LIGCTKQNGDAARKGCIAVLLVWFDLLVCLSGSTFGPYFGSPLISFGSPWLDFWIMAA
jgi:hypothetical protein